MKTTAYRAESITVRLETALAALRGCLADHTGSCVCAPCAALTGAEAELDALHLLAVCVEAHALKEQRHPRGERYWCTVWNEYRRASEEGA